MLFAPTEAAMTQDADLALISTPDEGAPERIRATHVVDRPGEFEFGGVLASAHRSYVNEPGPKSERNLIWAVELERIVVCHLGHLGHALSAEEIDEIGTIDVLMVPVGNKSALKPDAVAQVVAAVGPSVVLPYTSDGADANAIRKASAKLASELDLPMGDLKPKLSLTRSALGTGLQFVVLEPKKV